MPEEKTGEPRDTVSVWRVVGWGFGRGLCNAALAPGEFGRGFSYEFSSPRRWYVAAATAPLCGLGGTLSRCCAGLGECATLGYFGDVRIAPGYPDYVWQGDWLYRAPEPPAPASATNVPLPALVISADEPSGMLAEMDLGGPTTTNLPAPEAAGETITTNAPAVPPWRRGS